MSSSSVSCSVYALLSVISSVHHLFPFLSFHGVRSSLQLQSAQRLSKPQGHLREDMFGMMVEASSCV
ncbi:hypothetical protein QN277_023041 [Acacia crassicarpa]|uniref:Uncharacterized protein n=1 Tax=Acacia crassicarpa TaxID=499986 RepID=A0AAE1MLL3_9FABA|nr:hypothetical protein QN277_023041 [Acacia crassicarpa]